MEYLETNPWNAAGMLCVNVWVATSCKGLRLADLTNDALALVPYLLSVPTLECSNGHMIKYVYVFVLLMIVNRHSVQCIRYLINLVSLCWSYYF